MAISTVIGGFAKVPAVGIRPVMPGGFVKRADGGPALVYPGGFIQVSSGTPDPLAGLPFGLRLQTHNGDNVPLGLWQDVARTIPAVNEFDLVAAWEDVLSESGIVATQADPDKQPTLVFINGVPFVEFDGIDDFLVHGVGSAVPSSIFAVCRYTAGTGFQCLAGFGNPSGTNIYSRLNLPGGPWGTFLEANVPTNTDNAAFKVLGLVTHAPNNVDLITNGVVDTNTAGIAYYTTAGGNIGREAVADVFGGPCGALYYGPTTLPAVTINAYLSTIFAPVL